MSKFLVETHYTCTFKIVHELDELNEKALSEVDSRKDGKVEIVNVTVNNRKTKRSDGKKTIKSDLENIEISHKKESLNNKKLKNEFLNKDQNKTGKFKSDKNEKRFQMPDRRKGYIQKATIGDHKIYLHTGEYDAGKIGEIDVIVFNVGANVPMSILDTSSRKFSKIWEMACFAGFLNGREAAKYMIKRNKGTIIFTGATASMRGGANFAAFASAKHGLRALAQSMARELGPKNIHVCHVAVSYTHLTLPTNREV